MTSEGVSGVHSGGLPTEFGHVGVSGGPDPANQIIGTDEWTLHDNNTHTGSHGPKGTGGVAQWSSTETQRSTATWHKKYNTTSNTSQTTQHSNTAERHGTNNTNATPQHGNTEHTTHTPRHSTAKQNKQHKQDSTATRGSTSTQHKEHKQHSTAAPHNNTMWQHSSTTQLHEEALNNRDLPHCLLSLCCIIKSERHDFSVFSQLFILYTFDSNLEYCASNKLWIISKTKSSSVETNIMILLIVSFNACF